MGEHAEDLAPTTAFEFKGLQVQVEFLGEQVLDLPGPPISHFRRLRGMRIELTGGEDLRTLLSPEKGEALLQVVVKLTNRVLVAIRNFGTVAHVQTVKVTADRTEPWLRALHVESSEDGQTWNPVRSAPGLETVLMDRFLLLQENVGELNAKDWGLVQEAIQDDLKAGPEREFYVNALEHSRIGNLRLAVVESVICLEVVLTQWLQLVLPKRGVGKVNELLGPQLDLSTRVKLLLPLLLERDSLSSLKLDDVARNVNYRNKVAHVIGNLPDVPADLIRSGVSATLQLAHLLAIQRDTMVGEPALDKLAETMGTLFGLPKPKIFAFGRHEYSVYFDIPVSDELPNDDQLEKISTDVHKRLAAYDRRYRPGNLPPSVPSVAFTKLGQPTAVWLDGKLQKVAPRPKPSGLLEIARMIAESQKGPKEG